MNPSTIPQLDYAQSRGSRGRWIKRIFFAFLILSNLYFAYDKWGEGVKLQVRLLIAQRRCMKYSQPPTRIMLDSDPSRTAVLLSQGYGQPPIRCLAWVTEAGGDPIQLSAFAIEPASLFGLRKECKQIAPLPLLRAGDPRWLRLFAGQPDPDNDSRFTIRYETTNGTGSIEGVLADDDSVHLRILSGPLPTLLLGPASAPANAGN